jgi:hypothetical protein
MNSKSKNVQKLFTVQLFRLEPEVVFPQMKPHYSFFDWLQDYARSSL